MKILYFGGQKSGKTKAGIKKSLELSKEKKPYYIATYDNSFGDDSMQNRINKHILEREENFITIEEPKDLVKVVQNNNTYLIDCVSMWLFNNLEEKEEVLKEQLKKICQKETNIIFILNDVSNGIIPFDKESRRFVDFTGLIGQELVHLCDEVYEVKFGLERRLK
ncbi:MAG: bifunctional adenosylcobinamide kinase/adenosylcobinamide-phosphate guanylyltransferase [Arcobacter sp.]|jgi:adenosylcobinamide kinase/adenosylcobinamide-phosphate guanylyltransferase|uniref:bifunctional adenosylcobinamide kinase/adenosylcobinamide-phosphate guanylyltransferase n=1 Tax=unclassified Arcobacter TaxID=2593671 RepID=UPI000229666E|nr:MULTISPECIES: bifunctional adenosylcobinamide kinase/adenosylcobinamide-phosphate guanylyltransferase [unclassified Arcobacter]MDY3201571.1 bifunctional adenosylcobinamide kinase/adenosylcobinamide-phosphate guanylyltransferase [Arcobacter sp.]BAK74524.1 cobalamin biosynthesis protein CobP [Arcobacter sp. L]